MYSFKAKVHCVNCLKKTDMYVVTGSAKRVRFAWEEPAGVEWEPPAFMFITGGCGGHGGAGRGYEAYQQARVDHARRVAEARAEWGQNDCGDVTCSEDCRRKLNAVAARAHSCGAHFGSNEPCQLSWRGID